MVGAERNPPKWSETGELRSAPTTLPGQPLIRFPGICCRVVPLASRAGQDQGLQIDPRSPAMHVHDHLPLEGLQTLAKTIAARRVCLAYQAVILPARGRSPAGSASPLGCTGRAA